MNRRAEWSIIGFSTIDSASRQVVLRDSGNCSIGRRKIFVFGVSICISKLNSHGCSGSMVFAAQIYVNWEEYYRRNKLTGRSSQCGSLRLATRNCDMCSVYTWGVRISKRELLRVLRKIKYQARCMLLIRSW